MTFWVTSDHHFGHFNIIRMCSRPFTSAEEMNAAMIQQWNAVVEPDDAVFHLGDFGMGSAKELRGWFDALKGKKILIRGNHDKADCLKLPWEAVHDVFTYRQALPMREIIMFHYPIEEWHHYYQGAIHLHGHTHGTLKRVIERRVDVGVDVQGYTPVRLDKFLDM